VIQETLEPTDPRVREVYKVRLDPEDLLDRKVPKGPKALKAPKAHQALQPETQAIKRKEDHPSKKKSRHRISQNLMALRKLSAPGYLKEIIGIVIVKHSVGAIL